MSDQSEERSHDGYERQTINLSASHRWKASPGCRILVLDAGAVRLEYPESWHVIPKDNRLNIHDQIPPADEGRFQITIFRLPKLMKGASWDEIPLDELLRKAISADGKNNREWKDEKKRRVVHEVTTIRRPDLEYVWGETIAPDPQNGRPILTRQVLARARSVQPLITFDYYTTRADDYLPVWQNAMHSLRLGTPVSLLGDVIN